MKIAITYADENYEKKALYNIKTAYKHGKFDKAIKYSPTDLDEEFRKKYKNILSIKRGAGLWLWKPYIILKTLNSINEGDYLFYCDAGVYYINSIDYLINIIERDNESIMSFDLPLIEKHWTKRDAFVLMGCDEDKYIDSNQRIGGFILLKKNNQSISVIKDYLNYACDQRILSNDENVVAKKNYPYFVSHREDQSIWSLITKKFNIKSYRDPSQYGFQKNSYINYMINKVGLAYVCYKNYSSSNYPIILYLYRKNEDYKLKVRLRRKLSQSLFCYVLRKIRNFFRK